MTDWLPSLSGPDLGVLLLTLFLCLSASRIGQVGEALGKLFQARKK